MMKKFLLVVCGSFVGVTLALTVFFFSSFVFGVALASMGDKMKAATGIEKNSILYIDLGTVITEREGSGDVDVMGLLQGGESQPSTSLPVLLSALDEAADNDNIKGLLIDCNGSMCAPATREVLLEGLQHFKTSGKFIYAYGNEGISQGDYFLSSVADSIFLNPVGAVDVHGLGGLVPYYKKLLDKVGVKMQVLRVGTFKSAVEPYMLDSISPANRLQMEHYMGAIWQNMRDTMASSRGIEPVVFNAMVNDMVITFDPDTLVNLKLVDALCYRSDFELKLKGLTELDAKDDLRLVTPEQIAKPQEEPATGDHVAVLYAVGEIDGGSSMGSNEGIDTEKMVAEIAKLRDDDHVKGLVLRVNSPGGSAFGSEQMWHALEEFKATGKPFAVSMGDYAASGGYYISCGADRIFAQRTTITGSIGIFGMIPSLEGLVHDKLGVTYSSVKTNTNADFGSMVKSLTPAQMASMQNMVNRGYELFTQRCADGRHVSQDSIKSVAEGRVWDGVSALNLGLVDEIGSLHDAIAWVAAKAELGKDYKTQNYPALETNWRAMLNNMMAASYEARLQREMGVLYEYHKQLMALTHRSYILCLMEPVEIDW